MSRRKAIHDFCKQCIHDPGQSGTWRQQTEACPAKRCPLWPYRPVTVTVKGELGDDLNDDQAEATT